MTSSGKKRKNVVSWHRHFLVWGVTEEQLAKHLAKIKSRFAPIMPGLCAVHKKIIEPDQFAYKLWYVLKSPCKEYSIGKRRERDGKTGAATIQAKFQKNPPCKSGETVLFNARYVFG